MSDWEFRLEDFDVVPPGGTNILGHNHNAAVQANTKLKEWIEKSPVVFCESSSSKCFQPWHNVSFQGCTHQARLIMITPLAKCEHPIEKVKELRFSDGYGFGCECGSRVKATRFESVE